MNAILGLLSNFVTTGSDNVSPGIATTEFLTTVVGSVVVLFGLNLPSDKKAALVTLLGIAYVVGRSIIKALAAYRGPASPIPGGYVPPPTK